VLFTLPSTVRPAQSAGPHGDAGGGLCLHPAATALLLSLCFACYVPRQCQCTDNATFRAAGLSVLVLTLLVVNLRSPCYMEHSAPAVCLHGKSQLDMRCKGILHVPHKRM